MALPKLPKGIRFIKGKGSKKYTAIMPDGRKVSFGHIAYEHYKDRVPIRLGGKIWSHRDHGDKERMKRYHKRHSKQMCKDGRYCYKIKYTPSWFSYYFLW